MNTFQLECFLSVATTLSFAKAAKKLSVSQPTVTHQIRTLENELNTKLFRRSTRLVELTRDGEAFISDAKSMLGIAASAKMRFNSSAEASLTQISIGCGSYIQLAMLSDILNELRCETSNLRPRLFILPHEQLFRYLESERIDVVFDALDGSAIKDGIKYKELFKSALSCVCRADYPTALKESADVAALASESLILCDPMALSPDIAKLQFRIAEGRDPSSIHISPSPAASFVLARSGFGVALLPDFFIPSDPEIVKFALTDSPSLSFGMFYKPSAGDGTVKQLVNIAKEHFGGER